MWQKLIEYRVDEHGATCIKITLTNYSNNSFYHAILFRKIIIKSGKF